MGKDIIHDCCECVCQTCCIAIVEGCKWCCEEIEKQKKAGTGRPQAHQVIQEDPDYYYSCLLGLVLAIQVLLALAFTVSMLFGYSIRFYFIAPNIIQFTILVLVIVMRKQTKENQPKQELTQLNYNNQKVIDLSYKNKIRPPIQQMQNQMTSYPY